MHLLLIIFVTELTVICQSFASFIVIPSVISSYILLYCIVVLSFISILPKAVENTGKYRIKMYK